MFWGQHQKWGVGLEGNLQRVPQKGRSGGGGEREGVRLVEGREELHQEEMHFSSCICC